LLWALFSGAMAPGGAESAAALAKPGAEVEMAVPRLKIRQGLVYDRWPFRLDISTEYQDWILVAVCAGLVGIWTLPCVCGHVKNPCGRAFSRWVYTRLHVFFCLVTYFNLFVLMFTIGVLPDWTVNQFLVYFIKFVTWVLLRLQKLVTSATILIVLFVLFRMRERVALAAGLEHMTVFRWNWRQALGFSSKRRPVEVFIWKIEGLQSSARKTLKANDVFVECHMGFNEPVRTRVHNNAGSSCILQESFQVNLDESSMGTSMTLLVKDQSFLTSGELARLILSTSELCGIEDQTGKRRISFEYNDDSFVPLSLSPSGKIWIAVSPVEDVDDGGETAPLIDDDHLLGTC